MYFLRKAVATAAVFLAVGGASPLAGAESRYEWLVAQLQITEGEHYANRGFPKAFSSAEKHTGPEGKRAFEAATDRDAWLLQQLQMSDGNYFGYAFK